MRNIHFTDVNIVGDISGSSVTRNRTKHKGQEAEVLLGLWTYMYKRHPIPRQYGRAMGRLFWALWRKYTAKDIEIKSTVYNDILLQFVWKIDKHVKQVHNHWKQKAMILIPPPPSPAAPERLLPWQSAMPPATTKSVTGPMLTPGCVWRKYLKSGFTQVTSCRYHTTNIRKTYFGDIDTVSCCG